MPLFSQNVSAVPSSFIYFSNLGYSGHNYNYSIEDTISYLHPVVVGGQTLAQNKTVLFFSGPAEEKLMIVGKNHILGQGSSIL